MCHVCAEVQRSVKDIQEATKMTLKTQKSLKSKIKKGEGGGRERERERESKRVGEGREIRKLYNPIVLVHKLTWASGLLLLPIMGYCIHRVHYSLSTPLFTSSQEAKKLRIAKLCIKSAKPSALLYTLHTWSCQCMYIVVEVASYTHFTICCFS